MVFDVVTRGGPDDPMFKKLKAGIVEALQKPWIRGDDREKKLFGRDRPIESGKLLIVPSTAEYVEKAYAESYQTPHKEGEEAVQSLVNAHKALMDAVAPLEAKLNKALAEVKTDKDKTLRTLLPVGSTLWKDIAAAGNSELVESNNKVQDRANAILAKFKTDELKDPRGALREYYGIQESVRNAMENKKADELKMLDAFFEQDSTKPAIQNFQKALTNDHQPLADIKEKMRGTIENNHTAALKDFNEKTEGSLKTLCLAMEQERNRILFLAMIAQNRLTNKKLDTMERSEASKNTPNLIIGDDDDMPQSMVHFKGIVIDGQPFDFVYITGTEFEIKDGQITAKLGHKEGEDLQADLDLLALGIKSMGKEEITLELTCQHNQEYAIELGRRAYDGAIAAGFHPGDPEDPDPEKNKNRKPCKITVMVNGKKMDVKELMDPKGQIDPNTREAAPLSVRKWAPREPKTETLSSHYRKMFDDVRKESKVSIEKNEPAPGDSPSL